MTVALEDLRLVLREELRRIIEEQRQGYMNLKSAARYLDVTEDALRGRVKRGEIPSHLRDGRRYFERDQLDRYVRGESV